LRHEHFTRPWNPVHRVANTWQRELRTHFVIAAWPGFAAFVNVTPFEPEWEGYVTLEFSNTTPLPAKIYAGEGCAQVLFFESDEVCETSYKDRGGKYQGQVGVTLPKT
jgi:deoxycytidine triphosphate deaminase